jgi:hypothetical protein
LPAWLRELYREFDFDKLFALHKPLKINYTPFRQQDTVDDSTDWFALAEGDALAFVCALVQHSTGFKTLD